MDDLISREELLKAIDTWDRFGADDTNSLFRLDNLSLPHYVAYIHYDDVIKCIKGMPSVDIPPVEPKWIPVSERLPEDDGEYLATIYDTDENYKYMDIAELEDSIWQYKDYIKVLAWMPLPKQYEPQEISDRNLKMWHDIYEEEKRRTERSDKK